MSELISGKEALIALANGEEVQYISAGMSDSGFWSDSEKTKNFTIHDFYSGSWAFRLKPRTITLNGIEVPCNKSKHDKDDVVWVINTVCENWYDWTYGSNCDSNTLYWKSEDEIKQVVAALRKVFVINNQ